MGEKAHTHTFLPFILLVWSECRNVYTDILLRVILNELELTRRMCISTLALTVLVTFTLFLCLNSCRLCSAVQRKSAA